MSTVYESTLLPLVYLTVHFLYSSACFILSGEIIYFLLNNYKSYLFHYLLTNYAVLQKIALQHELKSLQPSDAIFNSTTILKPNNFYSLSVVSYDNPTYSESNYPAMFYLT